MRTALAIFAVAVVLQDPKVDIPSRVADLEKRVAALEQAASIPPPAAPAVMWTQVQISALFFAAGDLMRSPTGLALLKRAARSEDAYDLLHALGRAESIAFEAERQFVSGRPKQGSAMAVEALRIYNLVAKGLGEPERAIDSPAPAEKRR